MSLSKRDDLNRVTDKRNLRLLKLVGTSVGISAVIIAAVVLLTKQPPISELEYAQRLEGARNALRSGEYDLAESIAVTIGSESVVWDEAMIVAGEAAYRSSQIEKALKYYGEVSNSESDNSALAAFSAAEILRGSCRLAEALQLYENVARTDADFEDLKPRIAFLLGLSGQKWEAMPYFLGMILDKTWTLDSLAILGDLERPIEQPDFVDLCRQNSPDDMIVMMSVASQHLINGEQEAASKWLDKIIEQDSNIIAAHAMLGESRVVQSPELVGGWNGRLPQDAEKHPDIWFVRGLVARGDGRLELAAGCFAKCLELCPEHRRSMYQLGQALVALEDPVADDFVQRATQQMELSRVLDEILKSRGESVRAIRRAGELCEVMGRHLESWAWATTAATMFPSESWAGQLVSRVAKGLSPNVPRTLLAYRLTDQHDLSKYLSLATRSAFDSSRTQTGVAPLAGGSSDVYKSAIQFVSGNLEPAFVYNNGADPKTPGARMFEQTGGGVGVIDYDSDDWPDLYFPQGADWPTGTDTPRRDIQFRDHLYRNHSGKRLIETAEAAGIIDLEFSQGVAAGDYDCDGFTDLYVAAIGRNRLYRNNGDGTFSDISESVDSKSENWTSSCAMIDLTGDGLPELYDVNYVQGPEVFTLICGGKACSPKVFDGCPDELFMNDGEGGFYNVDQATPQAESKGLGILAGFFGDDRQPSLFISNDQVPNFFLSVVRHENGAVKLIDRALVSGVAYNVDGLAMACMGIAADDLDGNGRIDLLVTNFADEPNSLYLQDAAGLFIDATRASGMLDPSYPYVGWGTQFLDADLDGYSDLVVGNGHVDDYRASGGMFEMPSQFFRGLGRANFQLMDSKAIGDYFEGKYLSRGLARFDWNKDGLMDFAVSNLNQPASLVTNTTTDPGNFLTVDLVGTTSARDPFCAIVSVDVGDGIARKKQLLAGNGYMASNEKVIQFGLGENKTLREVTVTWPSGEISQVANLPANLQITIVERLGRAVASNGDVYPVQLSSL